MLELVPPDVARHAAWLDCHEEWGPGLHEDGFGLQPGVDVTRADSFAEWVRRMGELPGVRLWWVVEGDAVLGGLALRTADDEETARLGHVGYGIRPSARRRGVGTWALGQLLPLARAEGLSRLLLVCEDDNVGSVRTIEAQGGVLEGVVDDGDEVARRYWIEL